MPDTRNSKFTQTLDTPAGKILVSGFIIHNFFHKAEMKEVIIQSQHPTLQFSSLTPNFHLSVRIHISIISIKIFHIKQVVLKAT